MTFTLQCNERAGDLQPLMEGAVDVGVEVDGDPDILVAGQDFSKVARTQAKVSPCM